MICTLRAGGSCAAARPTGCQSARRRSPLDAAALRAPVPTTAAVQLPRRALVPAAWRWLESAFGLRQAGDGEEVDNLEDVDEVWQSIWPADMYGSSLGLLDRLVSWQKHPLWKLDGPGGPQGTEQELEEHLVRVLRSRGCALVARQWSSGVGVGDVVFSTRRPGVYLVVEVKHLDLWSRGPTACKRRNRKRVEVREQAAKYARWWAEHADEVVERYALPHGPRLVIGARYTNEPPGLAVVACFRC